MFKIVDMTPYAFKVAKRYCKMANIPKNDAKFKHYHLIIMQVIGTEVDKRRKK